MKLPRTTGMLALLSGAGFAVSAGCGVGSGDPSGTTSQSVTVAGSGVSGGLTFQSTWAQGYCANVTITNTGAVPTTSWQAVVNLNQSSITSLWSAASAQSGTTLTATSLSYNAALAPAASTTFGFCGSATGTNDLPALVSVSAASSGAASAGSSAAASSAAGSSSSAGAASSSGSSSKAPSSSTSGGGASSSSTTTTAGSSSASSSSASGATTCTIPGSPAPGGGSLTWYFFGQGTGKDPVSGLFETACGYLGTENNGADSDSVLNIPNPSFFVAIPGASSSDFNTVGDCGACVQITNGSASLIATVIDECPIDSNPACAPAGHLDLSKAAFDQLGFSTGDPTGVTWQFVPCPVTGDLSIRIKSGNPNQIYVQNEVVPIQSITMNGGSATQLSYGAWQLPANAAGATLTLTDIDGRSVTLTVPAAASGAEGASASVQFPACH